jgi:hypothetical protein
MIQSKEFVLIGLMGWENIREQAYMERLIEMKFEGTAKGKRLRE